MFSSPKLYAGQQSSQGVLSSTSPGSAEPGSDSQPACCLMLGPHRQTHLPPLLHLQNRLEIVDPLTPSSQACNVSMDRSQGAHKPLELHLQPYVFPGRVSRWSSDFQSLQAPRTAKIKLSVRLQQS